MTERQLKIICYFIWFAVSPRMCSFRDVFLDAERMIGNDH